MMTSKGGCKIFIPSNPLDKPLSKMRFSQQSFKNTLRIKLPNFRPGNGATSSNYPCDICQFGSKSLAAYKRHLEIKHKVNKIPCSRCNASFSTCGSYRRHFTIMHETARKRYRCRTCGFTSLRSDITKRHINNIHGQTHTGENYETLEASPNVPLTTACKNLTTLDEVQDTTPPETNTLMDSNVTLLPLSDRPPIDTNCPVPNITSDDHPNTSTVESSPPIAQPGYHIDPRLLTHVSILEDDLALSSASSSSIDSATEIHSEDLAPIPDQATTLQVINTRPTLNKEDAPITSHRYPYPRPDLMAIPDLRHTAYRLNRHSIEPWRFDYLNHLDHVFINRTLPPGLAYTYERCRSDLTL